MNARLFYLLDHSIQLGSGFFVTTPYALLYSIAISHNMLISNFMVD